MITQTLETIDVNLDMSSGGAESLSVTGNRAYGVTIRITDDNLVTFTYGREAFVADQGVHGAAGSGLSYYDSPCNFEDYTYGIGMARVWNPTKRIVGIFQIRDLSVFGVNIIDEQAVIAEEIYGPNSNLRR